MGKDTEKEISEVLDVEFVEEKTRDLATIPSNDVVVATSTPQADLDESETDFKKIRKKLTGLIEVGEQAIEDLSSLATESEQPRAYEVLGQLLKITSENTEKLTDLHSKRKKQKEEAAESGAAGKTINNIEGNAIFVGSTGELQKALDEMSGKSQKRLEGAKKLNASEKGDKNE